MEFVKDSLQLISLFIQKFHWISMENILFSVPLQPRWEILYKYPAWLLCCPTIFCPAVVTNKVSSSGPPKHIFVTCSQGTLISCSTFPLKWENFKNIFWMEFSGKLTACLSSRCCCLQAWRRKDGHKYQWPDQKEHFAALSRMLIDRRRSSRWLQNWKI